MNRRLVLWSSYLLLAIGSVALAWSVLNEGWVRWLVILLWLVIATNLSANYFLATILPLTLIAGAVNQWALGGLISPLTVNVVIFVLVLVLGFLVEQLSLQKLAGGWKAWLFLALALAQIDGLIIYLPVDVWSQAVWMCLIFYVLWRGLSIDWENNRERRSHFVFLTLAVILIIGSIIWLNFPYWKIF